MATTTVKTPTVYTTEDFDYNKALGGALCIITNQDSEDTVSDDTPSEFKGAGIVKKDNPNRLVLVYKGVSYYFKDDGVNIDGSGFNLKLATIAAPTAVGPAVEGINVNTVTRSAEGVDVQTTVSENASVVVADLNPRDEFAIQALQSMMSKIPDPSVLSNAEMDLYCKAAYLWASNMMKNAANARATTFTDQSAPATGEATISSLDNNTERLLNNLIEELKKNDVALGTWAKTGQTSVKGEHTDAWVSTHPLGGETYQTVAAAETAGWAWTLEQYSERIDVQSMPDLSGTINIGASGLGRDASHPINDLVHIGDSTNGKGETYGYPFYISGRSGTNHDTINVASTAAVSGGVTVSNTSGSNLNVKTASNESVAISNATGGNLNIKSASGESVTIKGNSTYSDMNDVLRVNVVAGGGGGGSTDTVHIGSSTNGRGESSSYPFVVKGGDSYTPTGGTQIDDVIKVAIVAGGGGGSSVDKGSVPTVQPSLTYTLEHVLVFQYDSYSTSLRKVALGDLGVPVLQTISNGNFPSYSDIKKGYYYKFITTNPTVVDIDLPAAAVPNGDIVNIVIFSFTLSATANFSVTAQNNNDIWYRESNPGATLAAGTYEIDCLADGNRWIIGVTKLVQ